MPTSPTATAPFTSAQLHPGVWSWDKTSLFHCLAPPGPIPEQPGFGVDLVAVPTRLGFADEEVEFMYPQTLIPACTSELPGSL